MNAGFLEIINHGQEEKIRLLQNKVDLYSANLEQYKQKSYNETQVRVDFVNFFFQLLGWDVLNENGLPQHLREVTHEANVTVEEDGESKNKKIRLRIQNRYRIIVLFRDEEISRGYHIRYSSSFSVKKIRMEW